MVVCIAQHRCGGGHDEGVGMFFSRRHLAVVAVAVIGAGVAGCGTSTEGPPSVSLSLVAPTNGATVYVRTIVVLGHVNPSDARVLVAGRWASLHHGTFRLRMRLPLPVSHIAIVAAAKGYRPASLTTTVRMSQLAAKRPTKTPQLALGRGFATRAEAICSTANQQWAALAATAPQSVWDIWHQSNSIRTSERRQLIALVTRAANFPAVRTFINDLHTKAFLSRTFFADLMQGNRQAALHIVRRQVVLAPRWWLDAGRLGVPDCGAVSVPAGQVLQATGH